MTNGRHFWGFEHTNIMNGDAHHVFRQVQLAWDRLTISMRKMYQASNVRPAGAYEVFSLDERAPDEYGASTERSTMSRNALQLLDNITLL